MDLDTILDRLHETWRALNFDVPTPEDREALHAYSIELDCALKLHPDSSDLWCIKGDWFGEKRLMDDVRPEFEERSACYLKAIELDPTNGYAYQQLGNVFHLHNKDLATAVGYFRKSIELGEGLVAHVDLALAHAQMGRRDLAEECLARALQTFGPDPEIDKTSREIAQGHWDPDPPQNDEPDDGPEPTEE